MGRKHKKRRIVAWEIDDECLMLAFLDFRISQQYVDPAKNVEAIVEHLWEKRSKRFTVSQVEDKLNEIQNNVPRKTRKGTIFDRGLRALSHIPHEEKVKRLKQHLFDEFVMSAHSIGRKTRSTSRGLGSSQLQRSKHEIPETPSPSRVRSTRKSNAYLSPRQGTSPLAKRSRFEDQSPCTTSNRTLSPKYEECDRETPIPPHPTIRVMLPGTSDISMDDGLMSSVSHKENVSLDWNTTSTANGSYTTTKSRLENTSSRTEITGHEGDDQDLKEELTRLKNERDHLDSQMNTLYTMNSSLETALEECKQRCSQYAIEVKSLEYTLSEKNPSDRKILYQQERQIKSLTQSLRERTQNYTFSQLSADKHHNPKQEDIQSLINAIHYETKNILFSYDDYLTVRTPDIDHERDLRYLLGETLGGTPSSPLHSDALKAVMEENGLQATICVLVASALCKWVFESDFESTIAKASTLLSMYRQHISSLDGDNALRNVDIAANKLLFGSDYYLNHVIPARAKELASRLSDALAPLIPGKFPRQSTERFHTWGEDGEESVRREKRLTDIFSRALRLKGDLLSSTGLFFFVIFPRGTDFDKKLMIAETKHGDRAVIPSNTEAIQACILPAIYLHKCPREGIVDYKLKIMSEYPKESDAFLITRAIVVLR